METKTETQRNKVELTGYVGMDPEVFQFKSGNKKISFSLATKEDYKDKEGNWVNNTFWHNVVAIGKAVKVVEENVKKGSLVALEGKIGYRNYEDKDGKKHKLTEITAFQVEVLTKPEPVN
jgi:single-strand DNA-binding protein